MASNIDQDFDENTELILHTQKKARSTTDNTGDLLSEMSLWSFGLPFAEVLPDNNVMIMYYAGNKDVMDIHWVRLRINQ
jgi:hypothetical protein